MKDILVSLKPYYYYLIGEGIKTDEIRKSMPKADDWSKNGWFYMSKDEKSFEKIPKEFQEKYRKHFGKVGLKFVCDRIDEYTNYSLEEQRGHIQRREKLLRNACLTLRDWYNYIGNYTSDKGYAWHITDLVIYDKPKELWELKKECIGYVRNDEDWCLETCPEYELGGCDGRYKPIYTPPMSWCYVEELGV